MSYSFVQIDQFQPTVGNWNVIGNVNFVAIDTTTFQFIDGLGNTIQLTFLAPTIFRVTFNPPANPVRNYLSSQSYAVVNYAIEPVTVTVVQGSGKVTFTTGKMTVIFGLTPYGYQVYDNNNTLVAQTVFGRNLVYSNEAFACLHDSLAQDGYYGFGERAGAQLNKKTYSLNFFNFDNFSYNSQVTIPSGNEPGPLNPSEPIYNSTPYLLTVGQPSANSSLYSYGLFFDNPAQVFFNLGSDNYPGANMKDKFYFGSVYGQLDYYIMVGTGNNPIRDVVNQFTQLTGRPALPPMYALGYHQGGYGYSCKQKLLGVAWNYRQSNFPIDGLHIDVDFQDNYRTFTASPLKFPDPAKMFAQLHTEGFKCSTNITGIITANPLDENASVTKYPTRDNILNLDHQDATQSTYINPNGVKPFLNYPNPSSPYPKLTDLYFANENYGQGNNAVNSYIPRAYPSPGQEHGSFNLGTYGYYCDMANPDVQIWWGEQYKNLLSWGLDMIWQDMTCPAIALNDGKEDTLSTLPLDILMYDKRTGSQIQNVYIHNMFAISLVEATYKGITKIKEDPEFSTSYNYQKRNFIIARGGYAGIQRYAGLWTGDSASNWSFLAINIPEILNFGLSGQPISGSDVGGFANGSVPTNGYTDPQLFTRWMTSGAFLPWYRNHYNQYTKAFQEPYAYKINHPEVFNATLKYVQIRYQLLQLFYDAAYQATQTGLPIARALFLNDPDDANLYNVLIQNAPNIGNLYAIDCQFFVGDNLLVAPVVTQDTYNRNVYLPTGSNWYVFDIHGGALIGPNRGGQSINWNVPLDLVPLYIREGSVVPIRQLEQYVGQLEVNPLTIFLYPGKNSTYTLYQDDKVSTEAFQKQNPVYRTTVITNENLVSQRRVSLKRTYDKYIPNETFYYLAFLGVMTAPSSVNFQDIALEPNIGSIGNLQNSHINAYFYDTPNKKVLVKVFDTQADVTVSLNYNN